MRRVLVVNGPNLNLLGERQPEIYGAATLADLERMCREWGSDLGLEVETCQSNHEGELIDRLHAARATAAGVAINPGALTHYSYALADAIAAIDPPTVEVHISNIRQREEWRRHSVVSAACVASIYGRGLDGYRWALRHLAARLDRPPVEIAYGTHPDQVGDLRLPGNAGPYPVAVLIHGGFWADEWKRDLMDRMAVALTDDGYATWNVEYRRIGSGGGWPRTIEDAAAAVDHLAVLAADGMPLDLERVVLVGHSAGGQLAMVTAGRADGLRASGVAGLAPVADLALAHQLGLGDGAVERFLRRPPEAGEGRYEAASPAQRLPLGVPQEIVHGADDRHVPIAVSTAYAAAATAAGDPVDLVELPDEGHFGYLDPESNAWRAAADAIGRLAAR